MRAARIELTGIGPDETANIACKLSRGHLHSETNPEEGNMIFPRIADGLYLSFATAISESARYQDPIGLTQKLRSACLFNFFSLNTVKFDLRFIGDAAVNQSLEKAFIGLLEAHVFTNNC